MNYIQKNRNKPIPLIWRDVEVVESPRGTRLYASALIYRRDFPRMLRTFSGNAKVTLTLHEGVIQTWACAAVILHDDIWIFEETIQVCLELIDLTKRAA